MASGGPDYERLLGRVEGAVADRGALDLLEQEILGAPIDERDKTELLGRIDTYRGDMAAEAEGDVEGTQPDFDDPPDAEGQ